MKRTGPENKTSSNAELPMQSGNSSVESSSPAVPDEAEVAVEAGALTAAQLAELKQRAAQADEFRDRLLRTAADFENYKKRAARERADAQRYANESLLQKLIPVLDNFEAAQVAAQNGAADALQSLQAGIAMMHQQLKGVLADAGLEEVDAAGKPFDPNLHEAISQQEGTDTPEGHVFQQLRKGYKLRDRLLRPATVVVAQPPAPQPAAADATPDS